MIPKVGNVTRVLSTATGALFVIFALMVAFVEHAGPGDPPTASPSTPTTASAAPPAEPSPAAAPAEPAPAAVEPPSSTVSAPIQAGGVGRVAYLFAAVTLTAPIVAEVPHGYVVEIVCTARGEAVTSELAGLTSSLWNGVDAGGFLGFIPDVYVDTGTYQAVMPPCDSTNA